MTPTTPTTFICQDDEEGVRVHLSLDNVDNKVPTFMLCRDDQSQLNHIETTTMNMEIKPDDNDLTGIISRAKSIDKIRNSDISNIQRKGTQ